MACAAPAGDALMEGIERFREGRRIWDGTLMEAAYARLLEAPLPETDRYPWLYWKSVCAFYLCLYHGVEDSPGYDLERMSVWVETAESSLKEAIAARPGEAECRAMLVAVYGFQIMQARWKAVRLGPEILSLQHHALRNGPDNPRVHYVIGTGRMRAPRPFRNLDRAQEHLERAVALFEAERAQPRDATDPSWGDVESLGLLGDLLVIRGELARAEPSYRQALALNPLYKPAEIGLDSIRESTQ